MQHVSGLVSVESKAEAAYIPAKSVTGNSVVG